MSETTDAALLTHCKNMLEQKMQDVNYWHDESETPETSELSRETAQKSLLSALALPELGFDGPEDFDTPMVVGGGNDA